MSPRKNTLQLAPVPGSLPEKYVQVGAKACKDVPPGMELCYYSNTRGKCLSTGSVRTEKRLTESLKSTTKWKLYRLQYEILQRRMAERVNGKRLSLYKCFLCCDLQILFNLCSTECSTKTRIKFKLLISNIFRFHHLQSLKESESPKKCLQVRGKA